MAGTLGPDGARGANRTSALPQRRERVTTRYRWQLVVSALIVAAAIVWIVVELASPASTSSSDANAIPTVPIPSATATAPPQSAEIIVPGAQFLSPFVSPILAEFAAGPVAANAPTPLLGSPVAPGDVVAGTTT